MILLLGLPTEPPLARAIEAAQDHGLAHCVIDQKALGQWQVDLRIDPDRGCTGVLQGPDECIPLDTIDGAYVRLVDKTPEEPQAASTQARLLEWLDMAPTRVANRPCDMLSNMSKTYQAHLIRQAGLHIPDTLVTNDPKDALAFIDECRQAADGVIYKSISGTRSIVQTFEDADRARLDHIRWCPTQFQRQVRGFDVRVHVVGQQVFATRIHSQAVDYRYARRQMGEDAELSITTLDENTAQACRDLSSRLQLPFTGIDLRFTPEGKAVCFEANPCPAYSYYESHTGAPIARALVHWLAGLGPSAA